MAPPRGGGAPWRSPTPTSSPRLEGPRRQLSQKRWERSRPSAPWKAAERSCGDASAAVRSRSDQRSSVPGSGRCRSPSARSEQDQDAARVSSPGPRALADPRLPWRETPDLWRPGGGAAVPSRGRSSGPVSRPSWKRLGQEGQEQGQGARQGEREAEVHWCAYRDASLCSGSEDLAARSELETN